MIREIQEKDFEKVYELGLLLHENFKTTYNLKELTSKDYFHCLVYEEKNQIIGFLVYTDLSEIVDLVDLIVEPKHRKKKVASNLIDTMITNLKPTDKIYLEVAVDNHIAIDLYQKFGFEVIHTREKYYGEKDAYVMERRITE